MIVEGSILLRIEHFHERCGGVAPEVCGHLIHLIEEKHGVA